MLKSKSIKKISKAKTIKLTNVEGKFEIDPIENYIFIIKIFQFKSL